MAGFQSVADFADGKEAIPIAACIDSAKQGEVVVIILAELGHEWDGQLGSQVMDLESSLSS
jgi:hypothetical protein